MRVAILGAGIQGCCAALELASIGLKVDLFDKCALPMEKTSRWNEGKIHLGYVYAKDQSLKTTRAMIEGSLAFSEFFHRHLGYEIPVEKQSSGFIYAIHKNSLLDEDHILAHFHSVDKMIREAIEASGQNYLGTSHPGPVEKLKSIDYFDSSLVMAAFQSPEKSVDTQFIADQLVGIVSANPLINFIGHTQITAITKYNKKYFGIVCGDGSLLKGYRSVVNTTWEDRLRIDQTAGYNSETPWIYRYKFAIHLDNFKNIEEIPSTTFLLGPFGDVVNFKNGNYYLSWYPNCCTNFSRDHRPDESGIIPDQNKLNHIAEQSYLRLKQLIPSVSALNLTTGNVKLKGGYICAIGTEDIHLPSSCLHRRDQGGIFSNENYHSIFTGKYTTAPLYARQLRLRITL